MKNKEKRAENIDSRREKEAKGVDGVVNYVMVLPSRVIPYRGLQYRTVLLDVPYCSTGTVPVPREVLKRHCDILLCVFVRLLRFHCAYCT